MNDLLVLLVAGLCFLLGIFTGDIMHILLDDWRRSGNTSLREDVKLHYDEWCDSCKEYDHNKHCCPRWNKVIKNTVEELKAAQSEPPWIPVTERLPEIVRCGDGCKFWNKHAGEQVGTCDILRQCTFYSFYCGNAKRKEVTNGN